MIEKSSEKLRNITEQWLPAESQMYVPLTVDQVESYFAKTRFGEIIHDLIKLLVNLIENLTPFNVVLWPRGALKSSHQMSWPIITKLMRMKSGGLIRSFHSELVLNDEPKIFIFHVKPEDIIGLGRTSGYGGHGKSFDSPTEALQRALGEFVERVSLFSLPKMTPMKASYKKLGLRAVDPLSLTYVSQEERDKIQKSDAFRKYHKKGILTFDHSTEFNWLEVHRFLRGNKVLLPAQLLLFTYASHLTNEPVIRFSLSTGAAAGYTPEDALVRGILEVIERDAYIITWFNGLSPERLDLASCGDEVKKLHAMFQRYLLEWEIVVLPTDLGVPVLLAILIDRTEIGPAVVVATAAGFDLMHLIRKVSEDAVAVRIAMRSKVRRDGLPDLSHLVLDNRQFYWFPTPRIPHINFLKSGELRSLQYFRDKFSEALKQDTETSKLQFLKNRLSRLNYEAYWTEITAPGVAKIGLCAVNVIIPALTPMHVDECFVHMGGERFTNLPGQFGLKCGVKPAVPHPFA